MPGRQRRPSERAIIYAGILGNLSLEKINELLEEIRPKEIRKLAYKLIVSSYNTLRGQYRRAMAPTLLDPKAQNLLGGHIYHPLPAGELPALRKTKTATKKKASKKRKPLKKKSH